MFRLVFTDVHNITLPQNVVQSVNYKLISHWHQHSLSLYIMQWHNTNIIPTRRCISTSHPYHWNTKSNTLGASSIQGRRRWWRWKEWCAGTGSSQDAWYVERGQGPEQWQVKWSVQIQSHSSIVSGNIIEQIVTSNNSKFWHV